MRGLMAVVFAGLLTGCATASMQAPVDVGGRWTGTWVGYGLAVGGRSPDVTLDLVQGGAIGTGWLLMLDTLAAESVPDGVRDAGMTGVRILFDVSGSRVRLRHELGSDFFEAELAVVGDRMVGYVLRTDPVIRFDLTRAKAQAASVPVVLAPATPAVVEPPRPATPPPPAVAEASPAEAPVSPARRDAPPPAEFRALAEVRTIHFDFDHADVRPGDAAILDVNAEWLRANPDRLVLIEGHCDERGTAEYNLALGERRARSAKAYLIGRGIADSRMTITSYGFEHPLCTEHAETCWARNRRAAFIVK